MRARERNDPGMLLPAHHCAWASRFSAGDLAGSREHIDAGLAIYDAGEFRDHAALYGNHDAKTCAHCERALVLWQVGQPGRAAAEMREAATWTAALDHIGTRFHLYGFRPRAAVLPPRGQAPRWRPRRRSPSTPRGSASPTITRAARSSTAGGVRSPAIPPVARRRSSRDSSTCRRSAPSRTSRSITACWPRRWPLPGAASRPSR